MKESSPNAIAAEILPKYLYSVVVSADRSLSNLIEKYKILQFLRYLVIYFFVLFLRLLPSLFPSLNPFPFQYHPLIKSANGDHHHVPTKAREGEGDTSIARALSQLLSIMTEVPVSSRKYELVRSLADKLIDDNLREDFKPLRDINRTALSAAFSRTLTQLEAVVLHQVQERRRAGTSESPDNLLINRVSRALRFFGDVAMAGLGGSKAELRGLGGSASAAEKLAAEQLWLAQKLAACGEVEEAIYKWGSASDLGQLAVFAEPRLQGSLVKVSAFLLKHAAKKAKEGKSKSEEESEKEQQRRKRKKMLQTWMPLLCRASTGTDAPVLSRSEREEVETVLEETIEMLKAGKEQEEVLMLWLHHFTDCPSSDWPNLQPCYDRWCNTSRKLLLFQ